MHGIRHDSDLSLGDISAIGSDTSIEETPEEPAQVAALERQLHELQKLLSSREEDMRSMRNSFPLAFLSSQLLLLEEENTQLRNLAGVQSEVARLRSDLQREKTLQSHYERLYTEAALRLIARTQETSFTDYDNDLVDLSKEFEREKQRNAELHTRLETIEKRKLEVERERNYLKEEVVPLLRSAADTFREKQQRLDSELRAAHSVQEKAKPRTVSVTSASPKSSGHKHTCSQGLLRKATHRHFFRT